ncbi:hypothetical protein RJ639_030778 [Escallonia herrerae]|uniref:RWP-RK domain-containing protein n=1 Tax=Escallonia herrerae TaxID=1293975 RepID=A0AA88WY80_9ASTE|nr:hypothetical protein RJ639_030778 [Escallonia herrerae]
MGVIPEEPFYSPLDIMPTRSLMQDDISCDYNGGGFWNEIMNVGSLDNTTNENQKLMFCDNSNGGEEAVEKQKIRGVRDEENINVNGSKMLTREILSQYFYMPITQAAKELNIGLTLLKKRCRELGIRRWPHRKLMSLQTLIKNVQELGKEEGNSAEGKLKDAIKILEQERKLMEVVPDMQLEDKTKRLRQACFKANYKKRKIMGMMVCSQSSSTGTLASMEVAADCWARGIDEEEEMKSLFSDCLSSSNIMFKV